jgi:isopenicillin-N N-acyltransferase-like protein
MITEGGIIGKIGLNSAGVGVCLNAIRARGIDYARLPTHLALRIALESRSKAKAVAALEVAGVGTSCHILIGDETGGTGLEFSHADLHKLEMRGGKVVHSNHFVATHQTPDGIPIKETLFLEDSNFRIKRIGDLLEEAEKNGQSPSLETVEKQLDDEENYPTAINRAVRPGNEVATLFSIVMDLKAKMATVRMGRPTESTEMLILQPTVKVTE